MAWVAGAVCDTVAAQFAVVVLRQSVVVAETVDSEDPSIGAVACMRYGFGARGAGAGRQFFVSGIELLAKFAEVVGDLGVGGSQVGVGAGEFDVGLGKIPINFASRSRMAFLFVAVLARLFM